MSRTVRSLAVLALAAWFLAGTVPAAAAPLAGPEGEESIWSAAWDWLVDLVTPGPDGGVPRPGSNSDAGGTIDPDGLTVTGMELGRSHSAPRPMQ
jgi:hypothetical protein